MKKSKLKRHYIRIILRPSRVLRLSFVYFYGRIVLSLALRGIKLPGLHGIKKRMPPSALGAYERQALIYDIKGERYSFRKGPLWLRKIFEKIIYLLSRNRFWLLIVLKTIIAFFVIAIPIAIFIIIRGVLPVPERVSYTQITTKLSETSNIRTDWLYTEAPFSNKNDANYSKSNFNYMNPEDSRGVSITPAIEPNAPPGLIHFGIGYYPVKLNLVRGFLVGETSPLNISKNRNVPIEVENGNRLRIQYYLFPTKDNSIHQCQIQLKDQSGKIITSITQLTPPKNKPRSPNSLSTAWTERFVPNTMPDFGQIGEFIINLKSPPQQIIATSTDLTQNQEGKNPSPQPTDLDYLQDFKMNYPNSKGTDITNNNCIFALGDFSFERTVINPPKRRGIIFILVDTLRANTAYDEKIMPNLNNYAKNEGIKFLEHRAQGNMTVPSIIPLMTSRYSREIGSIAFTYAADPKMRKNFYDKQFPLMASSMQNLGYRVGGIGWLSLFSETMQGGVDLGFHNAIVSETPEYEARQITEHMGSWLETYGDAPFFLYLHYNTMHGPYKPPLEEIDLKKFLSKPFGLNQKRQLYNGAGRYWDDELENIMQKLKDLGIANDVDIIITSDHGAQMDVQPWYYFLGVNQNIDGGYADKGSSLLDEEVRVPLIMHLAKNNRLNGTTVSTPTAHVDLFPTLYDLAGGKQSNNAWRGINLYPALKEDSKINIPELLSNRKSIYFDGHKYAGILYWGDNFQDKPMKYVRQLAPDSIKLYLTHNPWSEKISWYQPEIFSSVDLKNHTEKLLPIIPNDNLRLLRTAYFNASPSNKIIRFTAKYSGNFKLDLQLKMNTKGALPNIALLPGGIKFTERKENNNIYYNFTGNIDANEGVWVNLGDSTLNEVKLGKDITAIICSNGNKIQNDLIADILQNNICTFFAPPDGIIESNYSKKDKPVVIQKTLSSEQVEQIEGTGAGTALQNALRDWGYAK
jgi:arylsulfatase A-like enzyme